MIYLKSLRLTKTQAKYLNSLGFIVDLNANARQTAKHCLYDVYVTAA